MAEPLSYFEYLPLSFSRAGNRGLSHSANFTTYDTNPGSQYINRCGRGTDEARRKIYTLRDHNLHYAGDFGWNLAYATAYCYRHMTRNRIGIISAINHARRATASKATPFFLFDTLDRNIFASKLHEMIYLCWQRLEVDHPGNTYVPGKKAARICIQLNSTPFDEGADIDDLLRMLIHQMIHAYFLVCCGSPETGAKLDGRLLDDVQFGVLLSCINDISQDCEHGTLGMEFHAHWRQLCGLAPPRKMQSLKRGFMALDPAASVATPPLCEGKSYCQLDNRNVTLAHVYNWQVEAYSRAINENWESRGDEIHVPQGNQLIKIRRVAGPSSSEYSEMVWEGKRIAVSRKQGKKYSTLARMGLDNKFGDVKLPDICTSPVLLCLWQFIQYGAYQRDLPRHSRRQQRLLGPPILMSPHSRQGESIMVHVRVCQLADTMRFPELRAQALKCLYNIPATSDDPIDILRVVYDGPALPSSEFQSWCRKFLTRSDGSGSSGWQGQCHGGSNYEKLLQWHYGRFVELYHKHEALRDDCKLAVASLAAGFIWDHNEKSPLMPMPSTRNLMHQNVSASRYWEEPHRDRHAHLDFTTGYVGGEAHFSPAWLC